MRVKIGNTYYDSLEQPIMVVFDDGEKELIGNMRNIDMKYCSFPEESRVEDIENFMDIEVGRNVDLIE